jgi:hypothetical protein
VRLSHAPQDQLVRFGIAFHPQRRVSRRHFPEALGKGVLVAARGSLHGHRHQGLGHVPGLHQQRVFLGRNGVPCFGIGELGNGADVAGHAVRHRLQAGSHGRVQVSEAFIAVVVFMPPLGQPAAADVHG